MASMKSEKLHFYVAQDQRAIHQHVLMACTLILCAISYPQEGLNYNIGIQRFSGECNHTHYRKSLSQPNSTEVCMCFHPDFGVDQVSSLNRVVYYSWCQYTFFFFLYVRRQYACHFSTENLQFHFVVSLRPISISQGTLAALQHLGGTQSSTVIFFSAVFLGTSRTQSITRIKVFKKMQAIFFQESRHRKRVGG